MKDVQGFVDRITVNSNVLGRKPVFKGTRIPVYIVLQMLRDGATREEILAEYPRLAPGDVEAALDHASQPLLHPDERKSLID